MKPNPHVIEALRDALEAAEAGSLQAFAMASFTDLGDVESSYVLGDYSTGDIYAAVSAMADEMLQEIKTAGVCRCQVAEPVEALPDLEALKGPFN